MLQVDPIQSYLNLKIGQPPVYQQYLFINIYLSIMTDCGFEGSAGSLSMTTLRGGGIILRPPIVIIFRPNGLGIGGGASRITFEFHNLN